MTLGMNCRGGPPWPPLRNSTEGRPRRAAPTVHSEVREILADDGDGGVVAGGAAEGEADAIVALDFDRVG